MDKVPIDVMKPITGRKSRRAPDLAHSWNIPCEFGMQPTRRALELAADVRNGLENFEFALKVKPFVPAEAVRTFRIAANDHTSVVILPSLVKRLAKSRRMLICECFR